MANITQEDIVSITSDGIVTLQTTKEISWLGIHEIKFELYLKDLDPEATVPFSLSPMAFFLEIYLPVFERIGPESLNPIEPVYYIEAYAKSIYIFEFADVVAIALRQKNSLSILPPDLTPHRLNITVSKNELPAVV